MDVGILLLAAGSGSRFGGAMPKQYIQVCGKPLLLYTLEHLALESRITVVQPVIAEGDEHFAHAVAGLSLPFDLRPPVSGGAARAISMQQGLKALPGHVDLVAVHDAARPLPSAALLADVFDMAEQFGAAVPGVPVTDTIKRIDEDEKVVDTLERSRLRAVQTPQVARRDWFDQAIVREAERLHLHTDDASLLEAAGFPVHISRGDVMNRKITTSEDMIWLQRQLACTIHE
jgi:2-C-methyl-D-erythritol 4-phosphate cytidylyltransferase